MKLYEFTQQRFSDGGFSTEDVLACLLPLMKQVAEFHANEMVAPLSGIESISVEHSRAYIEAAKQQEIQSNISAVHHIEGQDRGPVDIVDRKEVDVFVDAVDGQVTQSESSSLHVMQRETPFDHPVFVPGYLCWEQLVGHHDPLTDVFCLGQILASLSLGLDFTDVADLKKFVENRRNLFAINADVHPVIARAIVRMTELHRSRRVQELPSLIQVLENYRQQDAEISVEPEDIEGFESRDLQGKQQVLLDRLQKRLFEISRRNRMLHFRDTMQSVNLTQASVPLSFDYKNIRDDQILVCDRKLEETIASGKSISLNKRLNFSEAIYLPQQFTKIARESRRDATEYGFEQLRLVLCTLNWSNLKEKPAERFRSPLVLVPVKLTKKRGVRDTWTLQPLSNDAEINPVIRYLFRQLYNIQLPQSIDLETASLDSLYTFIKDAIASSESAVELRKIDRPQIRLLHAKAKRRLDNYRRRAGISGRGVRTFRDIDYSYDPATYNPLGIKIFSEFIRKQESELSIIAGLNPSPRHFALPEEGSGNDQTKEDAKNEIAESGKFESGKLENERDPGKVLDDKTPDQNKKLTGPIEEAANQDAGEFKSSESKPSEAKPEAVEETLSERHLFEMPVDSGDNPYDWSFDLCNVTLANFRYRKMSLVRDYEELVETTPNNPTFESVFSLVPRSTEREDHKTPELADRFDVVNCDPTQASSIAQARVGETYIIQGPPGTGKSQTITNLIADYAARGMRVLFVCEKRAAIDVVFARLRKCGLGDLCTLIHDSQADKKSFVMDLKDTYERFLSEESTQKQVESQRNALVSAMHGAMKPLQEYGDAMRDATYRGGIPTSQLLERAITLSGECPELSDLEKEQLPSWGSWNEGRDAIESMVETLKRQQPNGILSHHPLRNLNPGLANKQQPLEQLTNGLQKSNALLQKLTNAIEGSRLDLERFSCEQLDQLFRHCEKIKPLAENKKLGLLDAESEEAKQLQTELLELGDIEKRIAQIRKDNSAWREKIARRDLKATIDMANSLSKRWVPIIRPSWWRLRKVMNRSYDFDAHPIKPSWVSVLTALQVEYDAEDELEKDKLGISRQFGFGDDLDERLALIRQIRNEANEYPEWLAALQQNFVSDETFSDGVVQHAGHVETIDSLNSATDEILNGWKVLDCAALACELETVSQSLDLVPEYLICLEQLSKVPEEARNALQRMPLSPEQIEAASALHTFGRNERDNPTVNRFDVVVRQQYVDRLEESHKRWMKQNAEFVHQQTQSRFLLNAHDQGATEGRETAQFKKAYAAGRKVLEHEFGKQMRYKSIRDLVSNESGLVVRDLKPIWLMSPLSVSDTLPLNDDDGGRFDVVIFDEASQITLEEAIPSMFRADQAIVVGDEQQLPPTDFFSAKKDRDDDEEIVFEHEGESITYDLESNSLLNHASRNLPSTMLGWHYRSRDEALISFSNWAFYNGGLLTIPEETIVADDREPLLALQAEDALNYLAAISDRPISFHFMEHGVYQKRRNRAEAEYIAQMIAGLLKQQDGRTIGVIAFSEAQQGEIEEAIDRLAKQDSEFSALLEAAFVREEDGQFVGLLIKNLENIQGDERDIILLSVCYAPDENGRMIMNFGPINKSGGEKRLNVAFSRAKEHMAIVSTIRGAAITNEYNTGANCLRNYLRYSEALSAGDAESAQAILRSLQPTKQKAADEIPVPVSVQRIAERLRQQELEVDFQVGNSDFRCDLGVKRAGDKKYRLGVLIDAGDYYDSDVELMDRELFRPRLLRIFGWQTYSILLKDWLSDSDRIVDEIVELCADTNDETE